MNVPFIDLEAHHQPLREKISAAIQQVIDSNAFAGGPFVARFEEEFAAYCGSEYAIGVGSGTEALWLSLLALGIGRGDEVITVPSSFMATAEAITYCGAKPVFVDVDEHTCTLAPLALRGAITPRTKAIIPVHLFGQPADMDPILEVAQEHGLFVVEDACQAHGAKYKGRKVGSLGDAGCFSFYPGKNLGAFGDAGAIVTNDGALRDKLRTLRDHGQKQKYRHTMIGWNCRMDGIQAAVLGVKLTCLDAANARRRAHAIHYNRLFEDIENVRVPFEARYAHHVYHIYAIRVSDRDEVMDSIASKGIGVGIHYPVPIHLQEAYRGLGYTKGAFPVAERNAEELISLPMFPELTSAQVERVVEAVKQSLDATAAI
jgi:dTDP-4-amino-4,6-dideoxygalactose transaminase